jgi:hypothetical protein
MVTTPSPPEPTIVIVKSFVDIQTSLRHRALRDRSAVSVREEAGDRMMQML